MASLERRIADLEASYALESSTSGTGGGRSGELTHKFVSGSLRALSHVRRQPIDLPPLRYEVDKLHDLEPFNLAMYVAALALRQHPDEGKARKILAEKLDRGTLAKPGILAELSRLERLISLVSTLGQRGGQQWRR